MVSSTAVCTALTKSLASTQTCSLGEKNCPRSVTAAWTLAGTANQVQESRGALQIDQGRWSCRRSLSLKLGSNGVMALVQPAPTNNSGLGYWLFWDQCSPQVQEHFIPFLDHNRLGLSPKSNPLTFLLGSGAYEDKYVTGSADGIIPS